MGSKYTELQMCNACWAETNPGRRPYRLLSDERAHCFRCGDTTDSGIFVRVNIERDVTYLPTGEKVR